MSFFYNISFSVGITSGSVGTEPAMKSGKETTSKRRGRSDDGTKERPTVYVDRIRTEMAGTDQSIAECDRQDLI